MTNLHGAILEKQTEKLESSEQQSHHGNLTFRGPCIVIFSYNTSQQDAQFLKFI